MARGLNMPFDLRENRESPTNHEGICPNFEEKANWHHLLSMKELTHSDNQTKRLGHEKAETRGKHEAGDSWPRKFDVF